MCKGLIGILTQDELIQLCMPKLTNICIWVLLIKHVARSGHFSLTDAISDSLNNSYLWYTCRCSYLRGHHLWSRTTHSSYRTSQSWDKGREKNKLIIFQLLFIYVVNPNFSITHQNLSLTALPPSLIKTCPSLLRLHYSSKPVPHCSKPVPHYSTSITHQNLSLTAPPPLLIKTCPSLLRLHYSSLPLLHSKPSSTHISTPIPVSTTHILLSLLPPFPSLPKLGILLTSRCSACSHGHSPPSCSPNPWTSWASCSFVHPAPVL